jgi:hypothetical protein
LAISGAATSRAAGLGDLLAGDVGPTVRLADHPGVDQQRLLAVPLDLVLDEDHLAALGVHRSQHDDRLARHASVPPLFVPPRTGLAQHQLERGVEDAPGVG